jgi:hypothetical protein
MLIPFMVISGEEGSSRVVVSGITPRPDDGGGGGGLGSDAS